MISPMPVKYHSRQLSIHVCCHLNHPPISILIIRSTVFRSMVGCSAKFLEAVQSQFFSEKAMKMSGFLSGDDFVSEPSSIKAAVPLALSSARCEWPGHAKCFLNYHLHHNLNDRSVPQVLW